MLVDGSSISSSNRGDKDGTGLLGVDLRVTGDAVITGSSITADRLWTGGARALQLTAGSVSLTGGAQLSSGGALRVTATDAITISGRDSQGQPSGLSSNTSGSGDTGSLFVSAPTLRMQDGGFIQAGAGSLIAGSGNAGSLEVDVGRLTLSGGAQLSSGGALRVTATDAITISGRDSQGQPSELSSNTSGSGDTGSLFVSAPTLRMQDGGFIRAGAGSLIAGSGNAGSLEVDVGRLTLSGGAQLSSGGALRVTATDAITISGRDSQGQPSGLSSNTSGSGDTGSLFVSAPTLRMQDGGFIRAGAGLLGLPGGSGNVGSLEVDVGRLTLSGGAQLSSGGALRVTATDAITISGRDSQGQPSGLSSNTSGSGDTGSLFVSAPTLRMQDGGFIRAGAGSLIAGSGNAGSLEVHVGRLTLSGGAQLSSSAFHHGRGGARP